MTRPPILIDEPEHDDKLLWPGLMGFSDRLAEVIKQLPASSPVLLTGDWGVGKTTLLLALQRSLQNSDPPRPTVWFDAWRYEGEPALLPALMRSVWDATPEGYRNKRAARSLFGGLWRIAVAVGTRTLSGIYGGAGVTLLADALKGLSVDALKRDAEALGANANPEPPVDTTLLLWREFAKLVRDGFAHAPPVILIDDLDRCSPDGAMALLDGLRTLVTGARELNCNFVVAIDRRALVHAISKKMGGISSYDGNRYIEKIFPLSFAVPIPRERDTARLINLFLGRATADSDNDHRNALTQALRNPLFANPRLMKRCINRYRLITYFESEIDQVIDGEAQKNKTLAKWIAATERWPTLRYLMVHHGKEYWEGLRDANITPGTSLPRPEADALLNDEGAQSFLYKELFGGPTSFEEYRQAELRLQRWGM